MIAATVTGLPGVIPIAARLLQGLLLLLPRSWMLQLVLLPRWWLLLLLLLPLLLLRLRCHILQPDQLLLLLSNHTVASFCVTCTYSCAAACQGTYRFCCWTLSACC